VSNPLAFDGYQMGLNFYTLVSGDIYFRTTSPATKTNAKLHVTINTTTGTVTEGIIIETYTYYDNAANRLESKTLTTADAGGNIYYHYIDEDFIPQSTITGITVNSITFTTVVGCTYQLQSAASMSGPWTTIATITATGSSTVLADLDGCLSHAYAYSTTLNTRVITKTGYSDAAWTIVKVTYTYNDNASNRLASKTLDAVDLNGNIYYHYMDEAVLMYGRVDKSRRVLADLDGCLSHAYAYSTTLNTRVITKTGYSDAAWTIAIVTYSYYDNTTNRMKSKTLAAMDAEGNIYYEYSDVDYNGQGYGQLIKSRRSAFDSDGCISYLYDYTATGRLATKIGWNWTNPISTSAYNDNTANRLESKTLASPDALGNTYYHYMDEAVFQGTDGSWYGRVDKSKRLLPDSEGCSSHAYNYSATTTNRIIQKIGYSDNNWTIVKVTYVYYDKTPDAQGNSYYHYMDESFYTDPISGAKYGRMDKSSRVSVDSDGCLSYTYTYSSTTPNRIIGKVGYSNSNWTTVKVTYSLYDDSNNRVASKTLSKADASGNIKYEYYNEDFDQNGDGTIDADEHYGRIYKTTASDGTTFTVSAYYAGTPLKAKTYQSGTYAGYLYYFYSDYTAKIWNASNEIGFRKKTNESDTAHTDYKKRNGVWTKYHEEDASGNKYWYKWDAAVDSAWWPTHPGWFAVIKQDTDGHWWAYAFNPNSADTMNPTVDWANWRYANALTNQEPYQLPSWPPAAVDSPTAPQVLAVQSLPLVQSNLASPVQPDVTVENTAQTTVTTTDTSTQELIDFKAGLKGAGSNTSGAKFVSTMADSPVSESEMLNKSFLATPAASQDRGAG
ncbi:MAG: hypothetical protein NTZ95_07165, partial [Candidatus Omnitrophica bacterium]|nr:hypothetical protein [Candidatus Omnitrophota bacterium]